MLYSNTINEILYNQNTGVEYEIALFYSLLCNDVERQKVSDAISERGDSEKIHSIISYTDKNIILDKLNEFGFELLDVSFETQNDAVGPSDIVMYVIDNSNNEKRIGLSVKFANTCTLNVTGRNFISDTQISKLKSLLPKYTEKYINEMNSIYGDVNNWFRRRRPSKITDAFIDLIRDAVIENWNNLSNKELLLSTLFHSNSPIEFWVITYSNSGYSLKTSPQTIDVARANEVTVSKFQTSYVAFYLDDKMVGHMQVKFNNGFVEKCKKNNPDIICQGVRMSFGQPFSSWNFSVEK